MATRGDLDVSRARIDATRRLCDGLRDELALLRMGDRRHGEAAHLLALAEEALTILMGIHKLLAKLERRAPAVPRLAAGQGHPLRRAAARPDAAPGAASRHESRPA